MAYTRIVKDPTEEAWRTETESWFQVAGTWVAGSWMEKERFPRIGPVPGENNRVTFGSSMEKHWT